MKTLVSAACAAAFAVAQIGAMPAIAEDCPAYPDDMKALIYLELKKEILVHDAYIGQKGCDLKLAVVVNAAANEAYARDLGERFVRLTKTFGPGPAPSKQIGKGIYSLLVGVFTSGEKRLVLGAKVSGARRITW